MKDDDFGVAFPPLGFFLKTQKLHILSKENVQLYFFLIISLFK